MRASAMDVDNEKENDTPLGLGLGLGLGVGGEEKKKLSDGFEKKYCKLVSKEGHVFVVEERFCKVSNFLAKALEGEFNEAKRKEIHLQDITTDMLERIIQYFVYKTKYFNSKVPIPEFPISNQEVLQLLLHAHYLDC